MVLGVEKSSIVNAIGMDGANALVTTGFMRMEASSSKLLGNIKIFASETPTPVSSGASVENLGKYLGLCDDVIVGSYLEAMWKSWEPN